MAGHMKPKPNSDELEIINRISGGELLRIDDSVKRSREALDALKSRVSLARDLGFIGKMIWGKEIQAAGRIEDELKGYGFAREHLINETMRMAAFHREREKMGYQPLKGSPNIVKTAPSMTLRALAAASSGPSV